MARPYNSADDEDEDYQDIQAGRVAPETFVAPKLPSAPAPTVTAANQPPASPRLENPVIQSFDTPAAASTNTVPAPEQPEVQPLVAAEPAPVAKPLASAAPAPKKQTIPGIDDEDAAPAAGSRPSASGSVKPVKIPGIDDESLVAASAPRMKVPNGIPGIDDVDEQPAEPATDDHPDLAALKTIAQGGSIDEATARRLNQSGMLSNEDLGNGQTALKVTPAAQDRFGVLKALAFGAAKAGGFLAAAAPGAATGAEIGSFAGPVGAAAGSAIGGLITGTLGSMGVEKAAEKIGESNDTVQSFVQASKDHPVADTVGNLAAFAGGIPKVATTALSKGVGALAESAGDNLAGRVLAKTAEGYAEGTGSLVDTVRNLTGQASIDAAAGKSAREITSRIVGQVAKSGGTMIGVDTAIKELMYQTGYSDQRQTLSGAAQAGLIGAFLTGHGIQIENHSSEKVANAVAIGNAAVEAGKAPEQVLGKAGAEIYRVATRKIQEHFDATGEKAGIPSVRQATQRGESYGVASAKFDPKSDGSPLSVGGEPPTLPEPVSTGVSPTASQPAPAPASGRPADAVPSAPTATNQTSGPDSSGGIPQPEPAKDEDAGQEQGNAQETYTSGERVQKTPESIRVPGKADVIPGLDEEVSPPVENPQSESALERTQQPPVADASAPPRQPAAEASQDRSPKLGSQESLASAENVPKAALLSKSQPVENSASPEDTTPASDYEPFREMARQVNAGAKTDVAGKAPSTAFQVLQRIQASGQHVFPYVAKEVSARVDDIKGSALSQEEKGVALRKLVAAYDSSAGEIPGLEPQREPQPIGPSTTEGKYAQRIVDNLTTLRERQNGFLRPEQVNALSDARRTVDRDLNRQALGPNPKPQSALAIHASDELDRLRQAQNAGARLSPSEHAAMRSYVDTLESDFTKQRLALGASKAAVDNGSGVEVSGRASADEQPATPTPEDHPPDANATPRTPPASEPPVQKGDRARAQETPASAGGQPTNFERIVGDKIDAKRTAFHADSGTLGIPRDQMPQVSAEHRGAFANFLKARGIGWKNEEVLPGSLKPSQADFIPAKVEKAKNWVGDSDRRILVSSDDRVVDGHHQWLARLAKHPDEPMPVVRLDAPAKDILAQVHEFPSAGMEKAPDLEASAEPATPSTRRLQAPEQRGDKPSARQARTWIADERAAGRQPSESRLTEKFGVGPSAARTLLSEQSTVEGWAKAAAKKGAELQSPDQHARSVINAYDQLQNHVRENRRNLANAAHRAAVERAVDAGKPVNADAVDTYKVALPASYARQGDTYAPTSTVADAPFKRPSRAAVEEQARQVRSLEKAAQANPDKPGVVDRYQEAVRTLTDMQRQRDLPRQPGEKTRTFSMPDAPQGVPDVLDYIKEQGGIRSLADAKKLPTYSTLQGDYDGAPKLGGYYHQSVFGGRMAPDRMAQILHENHGIGDGSVDGLWQAIAQAKEMRGTVREQQKTEARQEKQASRFDKDALQEKTAKGEVAVHVGNLSPGDKVQIGDQELTVRSVDPHTLDVELEDHSKYGVQHVADGTVLYAEKVTPAEDGDGLDAARPRQDTQTGSLFGAEDDGFSLRGENGPDTDRVARALNQANEPSPADTLPKLRQGERQGDLLSNQTEDLTLVGEKGIDHAARQAEEERTARESAEARAKQDREQRDMFQQEPKFSPHVPTTPAEARRAAEIQVNRNRKFLAAIGIRDVRFGESSSASGLQMGSDGVLYITPERVANSVEGVRGEQSKYKLSGNPQEWIARGLAEEAIHGAQYAVAREKGISLSRHIETSLPESVMPEGWRQAARETYGDSFDQLLGWAQKAEFVRQVIQDRWTGKVTEGLYRYIKQALDYIKSVAGFEKTSPEFRSHITEVEARLEEAAKESGVTPFDPGNFENAPLAASKPGDEKAVDGGGSVGDGQTRGNRPKENRGAFGTNQASAPESAANIARRGGPPDAGARPFNSAVEREAHRQAEALAKDAADHGRLIPPEQVARIGPVYQRGQEHLVRKVPDRDRVVKLTVGGRKGYGIVPYVRGKEIGVRPGTPAEYLDRLALQNKVFGDDQRFEGVSRDHTGEVRLLTSQPFIKGTKPTASEIGDYMADMGFAPIHGQEGNAFYRPSDNVAVFDAHEGNLIKTDHGIVPIDLSVVHPDDRLLETIEKGMVGSQDSLWAAKPGGEDEKPVSLLDQAKGKIAALRDDFAASRQQSAQENNIAAMHDAVETRAGVAGHRAGETVRFDLPDALDRQAASAVFEAKGDRQALQAAADKVRGSSDAALAAKYGPVYDHALANLDRLHQANDGYRRIEADQVTAAQNAGLDGVPWQPYVEQVHDEGNLPDGSLVQSRNLGVGRGERSLADAIAAGKDPGSMDLADIAQRQVTQNQRAVNEADFRREIGDMKASDGKPLLGAMEEHQTKKNAGGDIASTLKIPPGYQTVQAGRNTLVVHKEFSPLLKALYGDSAIRNSKLGQYALNVAAFAKHGTVGILDTYHGFRIAQKEILGFGTVGYGKGLAALNYSISDLPRALKAGEITQREAEYVRTNAPAVERGLRAGLNVGKFGDNLLEAAKQHGLIERIPVVGKGIAKVNDLIFHKLQRGAMTQAYVIAEARNKARFPDLDANQVARKSAQEVNEFFGNLGSQGFLKSKTMQDAARLLFFAPNWAESQIRMEGRGIAQAGKTVADLAQGKGFRPGVVAQAMASTVLASAVAAQALNLFTKGQPTWKNEEGHQWDAWIPGGANNRGFYFSPLTIAAEHIHALMQYHEQGESSLDAAGHILSNKLSGPARGVKDLLTGQDWRGQPFSNTGERLKAAAVDTLPSPLPLSGTLQKDPKAPLGYKLNDQPGSLERQGLSMVGLKVDAAKSARARMYQIAEKFRPEGVGGNSVHAPSAYGKLRLMLDADDTKGATTEVQRLVDGGKPLKKIASALGMKEGGGIKPELFTGSAESERKMLASLTPEQRQLWAEAQKERAVSLRRFQKVAGQMRQAVAEPAGA